MLVGPVMLSNPLQGCGNQSLQWSWSVNRQEMEVLSGQQGGNLGPGVTSGAHCSRLCASSVVAEQRLVAQWQHTWGEFDSLL